MYAGIEWRDTQLLKNGLNCFNCDWLLKITDFSFSHLFVVTPVDAQVEYYNNRIRIYYESDSENVSEILFMKNADKEKWDSYNTIFTNLNEIVNSFQLWDRKDSRKAVCLYAPNDDIIKVGDTVVKIAEPVPLKMKEEWRTKIKDTMSFEW